MEINIDGVSINVNPIDMNGASAYGAPILLPKIYEWIKDEEKNEWLVEKIKCGGCNNKLSGFENYCPCCGGQIGETTNPKPPRESDENNETK